ncbi:MAG: fibronectin type III-like domain-contianing protein, partial [Calditrichaeota bacterium]|nr:fibronectin type III-like domain-contianing protein [Calditrichota bacterium]
TGKPVVVLLVNGRPLAIPWLAEHMPAIIEGWQLGSQMGPAVADVLFGDANPSGKLPVTFPRTTGQIPIYYNHKNSGRPPDSTDFYTSKYLDVHWTPQFPFGWGLSYTTFSYAEPQLSAEKMAPDGSIQVAVRVSNTGSRSGAEVVQFYLQDVVASVTRPVKQLRGFERVELQPGESRTVTFTISPEDLAFYNQQMQRVVEPGEFRVFVGGNSVDVKSASFWVE